MADPKINKHITDETTDKGRDLLTMLFRHGEQMWGQERERILSSARDNGVHDSEVTTRFPRWDQLDDDMQLMFIGCNDVLAVHEHLRQATAEISSVWRSKGVATN